jgi:hypothetical protein
VPALLSRADQAFGHQATGGQRGPGAGHEGLVDAIGFVLSHAICVLSSVDFVSVWSLHAGAIDGPLGRRVELPGHGRP